jgi:hypothetical protein
MDKVRDIASQSAARFYIHQTLDAAVRTGNMLLDTEARIRCSRKRPGRDVFSASIKIKKKGHCLLDKFGTHFLRSELSALYELIKPEGKPGTAADRFRYGTQSLVPGKGQKRKFSTQSVPGVQAMSKVVFQQVRSIACLQAKNPIVLAARKEGQIECPPYAGLLQQ